MNAEDWNRNARDERARLERTPSPDFIRTVYPDEWNLNARDELARSEGTPSNENIRTFYPSPTSRVPTGATATLTISSTVYPKPREGARLEPISLNDSEGDSEGEESARVEDENHESPRPIRYSDLVDGIESETHSPEHRVIKPKPKPKPSSTFVPVSKKPMRCSQRLHSCSVSMEEASVALSLTGPASTESWASTLSSHLGLEAVDHSSGKYLAEDRLLLKRARLEPAADPPRKGIDGKLSSRGRTTRPYEDF